MTKKFFDINGILLDFGGTIDTNGIHWSEVLSAAYCDVGIAVDKSAFREAYRHGERTLAMLPIIKPEHNFYDVLIAKTDIQLKYLVENQYLPASFDITSNSVQISHICYERVRKTVKKATPILQTLSQKRPVVLVSNFYGNIRAVLDDLHIARYFTDVIESAVVGVSKPDPAIFALGIKSLGFEAENIMAVGDTYNKDIIPAKETGCKTVWLKKGQQWEENIDTSKADIIIDDFKKIKEIIDLKY